MSGLSRRRVKGVLWQDLFLICAGSWRIEGPAEDLHPLSRGVPTHSARIRPAPVLGFWKIPSPAFQKEPPCKTRSARGPRKKPGVYRENGALRGSVLRGWGVGGGLVSRRFVARCRLCPPGGAPSSQRLAEESFNLGRRPGPAALRPRAPDPEIPGGQPGRAVPRPQAPHPGKAPRARTQPTKGRRRAGGPRVAPAGARSVRYSAMSRARPTTRIPRVTCVRWPLTPAFRRGEDWRARGWCRSRRDLPPATGPHTHGCSRVAGTLLPPRPQSTPKEVPQRPSSRPVPGPPAQVQGPQKEISLDKQAE